MFKKTLIFFALLGLVLAPLSFNFKSVNFAEAETVIYSGVINEDTVWTLAGSPYIIGSEVEYSRPLTISSGATLTIEPGVVVKFKAKGFLIVRGKLDVQGTEGEPVVFTSFHDDNYAGDSDGVDIQPGPGSWGVIHVEGELKMDHAIVKYGGTHPGITNVHAGVIFFFYYKGKINITNSIITENSMGIYHYSGGSNGVSIKNSKIYNNQKLGILNVSYYSTIDATDNWWGDDSGPYHATLNPQGQGNEVKGKVLFDPWIGEEDPHPDPVIIVPGIMGSWEKHGEWVIDPVLHTYDNLIEAMVKSGYVLDENLFLFPYNWRNNNVLTADLLKQKIDEVKEKTESEKVDIVAHSMGGLISRYYVESNEYEDDVDQLIFLDTPHQGSPESYLTYEGAYIPGFSGFILKNHFRIESAKQGYISLSQYIREQVVSVEQLLPIYDYIQEKIDNNWQYRMYPVQYPRNTFLENLNSAPAVEVLKNRADITNIISSSGATNTLTAIRVIPDPDIYDNEWMDGYPNDIEGGDLSGLIAGEGDGTVPYNSLNFLDGVNIIEMVDAEHREITTKAQQDVIEILTGDRPDNYYEGILSAVKRMLFIRVYSPVDFTVYAPDGKVIGKDFIANEEINEIPGAFYSGFDADVEFVTIINPQDGDYRVELMGTDNGTYELGIDVLDNSNSMGEEDENLISGIISVGEEENFNFNYGEINGTPELEVLKDIDPEDLFKDLEELYGQGEVKEKQAYNYLSAKFRKLGEIYGKIEEGDKDREKRMEEFNKESNKIIGKLEFYLDKSWITQTAYNILSNNINNLIIKLTNEI